MATFLIFFYISNKDENYKEKILLVLYYICLYNLLFSIIELTLKKIGIYNFYPISFFHGISESNDVGGFLYHSEFNALLHNTTAFLSIYYYFSTNRNKFKIFYVLVFAVAIFFSILSGSRASFLGFFLCIIIYYTIATVKKFNVSIRNKLLYFVSFYFILICIDAFSNLFGPITKFYTQLPINYSIYSRLNIWFAQILMFVDKPFFGWGLDCFKYNNTPYQIKSMEILKIPFDNIGNFVWGHNELLQLLCEGGIFLTLFIIYLLYQYFKVTIRKLDEKRTILFLVLLLFIVHAMFSWPLRNPTLMLIFVSMMAIVCPSPSELIKDNNGNLLFKIPFLLVLVFLTFFIISFGNTILLELNNIPKIDKYIKKKEYEKAFITFNKLSKNKYISFESNLWLTYLGMQFVIKDIFGEVYIPTTKEMYTKTNEAKLFNYDKMDFVDFLYRRAKLIYDKRPYSLFKYEMAFFQIIKGNYNLAYKLAQEAEKLKPGDNSHFNLIHFANVLNAAKKTGRPVEDFLPSEEDLKSLQNSIDKQLNPDVFKKE